MNLLVIGNGFDLAHGLPTRYSDFLDFMALSINKVYDWRFHWGFPDKVKGNKKTYYHELEYSALDNILVDLKQFPKFNEPVKNIFNNNEIEQLINNNFDFRMVQMNDWLRYLLCIYSYKKSLENPAYMWIDIEYEIEELLIRLQSLEKIFGEESIFPITVPYINGNDKTPKEFYFTTLFERFRRKNNIPEDKIKSEVFSILFQDLEKFNLLLKFYLTLVQKKFHNEDRRVFNINTNSENAINIDHIISFNYTDISSIYLTENQKSNIHYINGNLDDDSKIILGFENPDSNKTNEFCDNNINLFFKDNQRNIYDVDYRYNTWIKEYKEKFDEKINVYIIGHSLALSDKKILLDIMDKVDHVTIYYHSNEDKRNKNTNLLKILGEDKFFKYSSNSLMVLKSQKEIEIKENL